ncbi:hypothetical protein [Gimesia maris]|uniref:hypothetical protein n=1 Tax=Gimesia maris TaxID=122 RepID=UPI0030DD02C5|tara:strand:+ start:263889 stop:265091 length:1203 start_codon:yes stop_codon:yes gene_type:complete
MIDMFESFDPEYLSSELEKYTKPDVLKRISESCYAKTVTWRWASDDMSRKEPFRAERYNTKHEWLKEGARPKPGDLRHGLDNNGRIQVIENYWLNDKRKKEPYSTCYLIYGKSHSDEIQVTNYNSQVRYLRRFRFKAGHPIRSYIQHHFGSVAESHYSYANGKLVTETSVNWESGEVSARTQCTYECDEWGGLERIIQRYLNEDGSVYEKIAPIIEYERPRKNENLSQLAKQIEPMLLVQILETIEQASPPERFYCLLLCYCEEDFSAGWPPFLLLGSLQERERIMNSSDPQWYLLWAPDEMRNREQNVELPLNDNILERKCAIHCRQMDQIDDYRSGKKILRKVVKKLNKIDWSQTIDVTPDFIVAAIDNTGEKNPYHDIKSAVSWSRFRSLKKQGYLS